MTTIQKAIERAQALAPVTLADRDGAAAPALDVHTLRRAVGPVVRDALGPVHEMLAQLLASRPSPSTGAGAGQAGAQAMHARLNETALEDAHARVRRLEDENARLRRDAGHTDARASIAESRVTEFVEELHRAFAESAANADALTTAAERLDGTAQFLKLQNDAVREQANAEADALRRQVKQLQERVDHLLFDNDQYRRALVAKGGK